MPLSPGLLCPPGAFFQNKQGLKDERIKVSQEQALLFRGGELEKALHINELLNCFFPEGTLNPAIYGRCCLFAEWGQGLGCSRSRDGGAPAAGTCQA
jgi:hypothetical protein